MSLSCLTPFSRSCPHGLEENPNSSLSPTGPCLTYLSPIHISDLISLPAAALFALYSSHTNLPCDFGTHQPCPCLRAFALAVPSANRTLLLNFLMAVSSSSFYVKLPLSHLLSILSLSLFNDFCPLKLPCSFSCVLVYHLCPTRKGLSCSLLNPHSCLAKEMLNNYCVHE